MSSQKSVFPYSAQCDYCTVNRTWAVACAINWNTEKLLIHWVLSILHSEWSPAEKVCNYRIKNHLISSFAHKDAKLRLHGNILISTFSNLNVCLCNIRDEINSTGLYEVLCTAENLQVAEYGPAHRLTPTAWYHSINELSPPKQQAD